MIPPKIRADYALNASIPNRQPTQLPIEIALINGNKDPLIRMHTLADWSLFSTTDIIIRFLEGHHFYMNDNVDVFINEIAGLINGCRELG